jgi:hypothetical protein
MIKDPKCRAFWFTFPGQPQAPLGLGVTARSLDDAYALLEERGFVYHRQGPVEVREDVTVADLDQTHVAAHMGPIVFRGIWYPCLNIGLGASGSDDPESA